MRKYAGPDFNVCEQSGSKKKRNGGNYNNYFCIRFLMCMLLHLRPTLQKHGDDASAECAVWRPNETVEAQVH